MSTSVCVPTAVVGAGAVGTALAVALARHDVPIAAVISRNQADAEALAERVQAARATTAFAHLPARTARVLFCVPDDALSRAAQDLADRPHRTAPWIAMHPSGAHPARVLAPLRACGAALLSAHPLQTIPPGTTPDAFAGVQMTLEGDPEALPYGHALAQLLGATPRRLASDAKPLYHLAAVLASNGLVALLATAQHVWEAAGLPAEEALQALAPLIDTTWRNVQREGAAALTGPAARGDDATIAAHLQALHQAAASDTAPALLRNAPADALYAALTRAMLRIQQDRGLLSEADAARVRRRLPPHAAPGDAAPEDAGTSDAS